MSDLSTLPAESKSEFNSCKEEFLVTEALGKKYVLRSRTCQIKFWFLNVKNYEKKFLKDTANKEEKLVFP